MTFTTDYGIGILAVSESVVLLVAAAYGLGFCICGASKFISALCTRPQSCIFASQICQIFLIPLLPLVAS
jgi:hypothetical protein